MKDKKEYKIGVISDTHGLLRDEVRVELTGCDYIIHGGDINKESILEELKKIAPLYVVKGNNDKGEWSEKLPEELYFTIDNQKMQELFLTETRIKEKKLLKKGCM